MTTLTVNQVSRPRFIATATAVAYYFDLFDPIEVRQYCTFSCVVFCTPTVSFMSSYVIIRSFEYGFWFLSPCFVGLSSFRMFFYPLCIEIFYYSFSGFNVLFSSAVRNNGFNCLYIIFWNIRAPRFPEVAQEDERVGLARKGFVCSVERILEEIGFLTSIE